LSCSKYIDWISAALDGELTAEDRRELDGHLAVCSECAALYEQLSAQSRALRELDAEFPAGLHDRIMGSLPAQDTPAKKKNNVIRWKRWGTLAACLVLVVAIGAFGRFGFRMGSMAPAAAEMSMQEAPAGNTKADNAYGQYSADGESTSTVPEEPAAMPAAIPFSKVHYLHVDWQENMAAPSATVITNADSLALYLDEIRSPYDNGTEGIVFGSVLETYPAEFFTDRSLLMVLLAENSGSISHEILSVTGDTVTIRRIVPEVGTCDMAGWLLLVELDELLDDGSVLNVNFTK